jgi:hypothetical protein
VEVDVFRVWQSAAAKMSANPNAIRRMGAAMIERRAVPRHRVLKGGTIAFAHGSVECTVRNMSPQGARIDLARPVGLPNAFTLVIRSDMFTRRCHQVWNTGNRIGVAFD